MAEVDELMSTCPLKHEIRVKFWSPFIRKLKRTPINYLTLYSPPLMDVKYFHLCGYLSMDSGVYTDVVGVTVDKDAFADSNSSLDYRLGLLLPGNINDLLVSSKSKTAKQLEQKFPFDVINLDYTDALHKYNDNVELSSHFKAIEAIFKKQRGKNGFILFVTTKVNLSSYNKGFLDDLKNFLDENIATTPDFLTTLQHICNCSSAEEFIKSNTNNFFVVALIKFILRYLKDYGYDLKEGGVKWLVRDNSQPERYMLHLAFHIISYTPPGAKTRRSIGRRANTVEHSSVKFIRATYDTLKESVDYEVLMAKYSAQIELFNKTTFELKVPEPKNE